MRKHTELNSNPTFNFFAPPKWTPYTYFSDNRHQDFEVKDKKQGEHEVFHNFHCAHRDHGVFLYHICQDKCSLDSDSNDT